VMNCPACGRARGEVKFYVKGVQEGQVLTQEQQKSLNYLSDEQAKYVSKNPDWYCSFCNSLNSDNAQFCSNCGASRENSEANYFEMKKKMEERELAERAAQPTPTPPPKSGGGKRLLIIAVAVVLAIVGIFVFLNGKKTSGDWKVTALNWQRAISIEEYTPYQESGWDLPEGAELTRQAREIHHYDQVLDHYQDVEVQRSRQVVDYYKTETSLKDRGNGTFEEVSRQVPVYKTEYYTETVSQPVYRQEPRYATKYYYTIWRWTPTREVSAGGEDHNAAWPEATLGENEREGQKAEEYRFTVENEKKKAHDTYRLAEAAWRNVNVGDSLYITAKRTGADACISDEKGNKIAEIEHVQ